SRVDAARRELAQCHFARAGQNLRTVARAPGGAYRCFNDRFWTDGEEPEPPSRGNTGIPSIQSHHGNSVSAERQTRTRIQREIRRRDCGSDQDAARNSKCRLRSRRSNGRERTPLLWILLAFGKGRCRSFERAPRPASRGQSWLLRNNGYSARWP